MKYRVTTPLARGSDVYTNDDIIEINDKAEAGRMIEAGIIAPLNGKAEAQIETADMKQVGVEKAVKTGPKKG
jgi:hypothetical protein